MKRAELAQLVEQPPCKRQVISSSLILGSIRSKLSKKLAFLIICDAWPSIRMYTRLHFFGSISCFTFIIFFDII